MPRRWPNMSTLVQRIKLEFEEDPGLALTVEQGARFWAIDTAMCECVLTGLQEAGVLVKSVDGHFRQRPVV